MCTCTHNERFIHLHPVLIIARRRCNCVNNIVTLIITFNWRPKKFRLVTQSRLTLLVISLSGRCIRTLFARQINKLFVLLLTFDERVNPFNRTVIKNCTISPVIVYRSPVYRIDDVAMRWVELIQFNMQIM